MHKVDVEKVNALQKAGWETGRIAAEMHMKPDAVDKVLSEYRDMKRKEAELEEEKKKGMIGGGESLIPLTSGQLKKIYEEAAAIGAKEALKAFKEERRKEQGSKVDRRLRNTRLLLRNYHMLKEHSENSVFGRVQMEESALDILESMMSMYDSEVVIESIKRSATRTAIMVSHIETMFKLYSIYCGKAHNRAVERRRYEVLWDMYMAEDILSAKEIAEKQHISKDTVYTDLRIATERLAALIFGVDGLNVR